MTNVLWWEPFFSPWKFLRDRIIFLLIFFLSIHKCLIQCAMSNAFLLFSRQLDTNFFINWYFLKLRKAKLAKKLIKIKHFFNALFPKQLQSRIFLSNEQWQNFVSWQTIVYATGPRSSSRPRKHRGTPAGRNWQYSKGYAIKEDSCQEELVIFR